MKVFVDTIILVYLFDERDDERRARAASALDTEHSLVISTQVLIELHSVLRRKLRFTHDEAADAVSLVDYPTVPTDRPLFERATSLASSHDLSIFDAMVLEAAATAECDAVWTEDLATDSTLNGVRIINPLAAR